MVRRDTHPERSILLGGHRKHPSLNRNQRLMLEKRGLDPKNFEFVKETYAVLYVRDIRTGMMKILNKNN
jgi:hypothetical protein